MEQAAYLPVHVLRRLITDLEAALAVCQAEPGVKPVHRLRTGTRRVEAMLLLLELAPGLPAHTKHAANLGKALTRLRRAAGTVRDLDVHREMLESLAKNEHLLAEATGEQPSCGEAEAETNTALEHSATALREQMAHQRAKAAADLQTTLKKHQNSTTLAAERLLRTLAPAAQTPLPLPDLLGMCKAVQRRNGPLTPARLLKLDKDQLHDLRKAAKSARYIAETAPDDATLRDASRRFEALQEAGGLWHDALELASAARHAFGRHHPLTELYRSARKQQLKQYRAALLRDLAAAERPTAAAPTPAPALTINDAQKPSARSRSRPRVGATA